MAIHTDFNFDSAVPNTNHNCAKQLADVHSTCILTPKGSNTLNEMLTWWSPDAIVMCTVSEAGLSCFCEHLELQASA